MATKTEKQAKVDIVLSALSKKKGDSVSNVAKAIKGSETYVRSIIGYLRGQGYSIEALGDGVFKATN